MPDTAVRNEITIDLVLDGDQESALIGLNLAEGISGFGDDKDAALRSLAKDIIEHPNPSKFMRQVPVGGSPNLGLATTEQLLDELRARAAINGTLHYRTVDLDKDSGGVAEQPQEIRVNKATSLLEDVQEAFMGGSPPDYVLFGEKDITDDEIAALRKNGHVVVLRENYVGGGIVTLINPGTQCRDVKKYSPVQNGVERVVSVWRPGHSGPRWII